MGCYHFHLNQLSRGKGQSAIASAAYRAGTKLECTYYGEVSDYTRKLYTSNFKVINRSKNLGALLPTCFRNNYLINKIIL